MLFNLSPIYFACKSSNHKLFRNRKISPDTNLQKIYTNIKHKIFEELVPSVLPLLKKKKALKARARWYHGPFRRFINTRFLKSIKKKKMERSNTKLKKY